MQYFIEILDSAMSWPFWPNLEKGEQLSWDTAKLIIQYQKDVTIIAITVLVGIAVLLIAATWIYNFFYSKREFEITIKDLKEQMAKKTEEKLDELSKKIRDEIEKLTEVIYKANKAETNRVNAVFAYQMEHWPLAAVNFSIVAKDHTELGREKIVRDAVGLVKKMLDRCTWIDDDNKNKIRENIPSIPDYLSPEKKEIEDKLDQLPNEPPAPAND